MALAALLPCRVAAGHVGPTRFPPPLHITDSVTAPYDSRHTFVVFS